MQTIEQKLNAREGRRLACDDRAIDRLEERVLRIEDAEKMIGQLIRNGEVVFYVMPQGGKYREGKHRDLVEFLLRNNYA